MEKYRRPILVFLSGTSAVGKSELVNALKQDSQEGESFFVMRARDAREKMGNPSWDDLISPTWVPLTILHQQFVLQEFMSTVLSAVEQQLTIEDNGFVKCPGNNVIYFERSLLDPAGYSYAFGLSPKLATLQLQLALEFIQALSCRGIICINMYYPIDPNFNYAIEEARPPEHVRIAMDSYVGSLFSLKDYASTSSIPLLEKLIYHKSEFLRNNIDSDQIDLDPDSDEFESEIDKCLVKLKVEELRSIVKKHSKY